MRNEKFVNANGMAQELTEYHPGEQRIIVLGLV